MLGYLMFGSSLEPYQTLTDSMVTIFRAMYGDVDFLQVRIGGYLSGALTSLSLC